MSQSDIDDVRGRWGDIRRSWGLADILDEDFGVKGLARHAAEVHVRLLILPADPLLTAIRDFDDQTWDWWVSERPNPFEGAHRTDWGTESTPVSDALVRFSRWRDDPWEWDSYLALHRSGALEFGLGRLGSRTWQREGDEEIRVFFLTHIVGRVWWALSGYEDVIQRLELIGPWQVTLGFRSTLKSVLGNVAAGWEEPFHTFAWQPPECPDPNVLIVREVTDWPQGEAIQNLAFSLGGAIEDAWGFKQRRFLSRIEPGSGEFDVSRYG